MALEEVYKSYKELAELIDWKKYSPNELFRKYIEHENDNKRDYFYAALMCRYWGQFARIYTACNKHVPIEQCYDILVDALNYTINKRVWENPESSIYEDESGPDKAMHVAIKRYKSLYLSNLNTDKRKSNFNTLSIDEEKEKYSDSSDGLLFNLEDLSSSEDNNFMLIVDLVNSYLYNNKYIEALMIDKICYGEYNIYNDSRFVSSIKNISKEDFNYYNSLYDIDEDKFYKTLYDLGTMDKRLIYVKLKRLLDSLRGIV